MSLVPKRLLLLALSVLSIFALGSGVASAAGKPTSLQIASSHELGGLTRLELVAKVNPNGASTSATIEVSPEGSSIWFKGETHTLSGTTVRSYSEELPVNPVANYEVRLTASNLYGTTVSTIGHGYSTRVWTTGEKELTNVPYGSNGIANFAFTYLSLPVNVECSETSFGRFGNVGGSGDIYNFEMTNCAVYISGTKSSTCKAKNFTFALGGPTLAIQKATFISIPISGTGCGFSEGEYQITTGPFRVVDNSSLSEYSKIRSVSLTATGHLFASNPAEVTIESGWFLSKEYASTPFKIADTGL